MHHFPLGGASRQSFNLERSVPLVGGKRKKCGQEERRLAARVPKTVDFDCVMSVEEGDDTGQESDVT